MSLFSSTVERPAHNREVKDSNSFRPIMNLLKSIAQLTKKDEKYIRDHTIKSSNWYFEKTANGVKPVIGKYNPEDPNHVKKSKVITIYEYGDKIDLKD